MVSGRYIGLSDVGLREALGGDIGLDVDLDVVPGRIGRLLIVGSTPQLSKFLSLATFVIQSSVGATSRFQRAFLMSA